MLSNAEDDADAAKIWRLHTCCWAARSALAVDGDFVECGTYKGFYASVMTQYMDFKNLARTFYLYDTFAGLPEDWSTELERTQANPGYTWNSGNYAWSMLSGGATMATLYWSCRPARVW